MRRDRGGSFTAAAWLALVVAVILCRPALADPVYDKPIYDPDSKSYFELIYVTTTKYSYRHNNDITWGDAMHVAESMEFNGVRGRLALVKDIETHDFLLRTFQPTLESWIGMRYWCGVNKLEDVTGSFISPGTFQAWDKSWDHSSGYGCIEYKSYNTRQYMPVYYLPVSQGFRWAAQGWKKAYYCFFVEFPTGKP